jgi:hypothetical protein
MEEILTQIISVVAKWRIRANKAGFIRTPMGENSTLVFMGPKRLILRIGMGFMMF